MKYRTKPCEIEAFQLNERGLVEEDWFWDAVSNNDVITHDFGKWNPEPAWCEIKTLEGTMIAKAGDYIIRGLKGELYPCRADIFEMKYEPIEQKGEQSMERLTEKERNFDGTAISKENLVAYGAISDYCEKVLTKLADYEDKQEQGLLIELPCKVGDTIYYIEDGFIYKFKANEIHIRMENGEYIFCIDYMDYKADDFGKIAFTTLSEAEEALAKMGGSHEDTD